MTDRERLLAALDELPWQLLRELADEAEESGELWLAAGYRALAEGRHWPRRVPRPNGANWWWSARDQLPGEAFHLLPHELKTNRGGTLSECVATAAYVVGESMKKAAVLSADHAVVTACEACKGTGEVRYSTGMREPCERCKLARKRARELAERGAG